MKKLKYAYPGWTSFGKYRMGVDAVSRISSVPFLPVFMADASLAPTDGTMYCGTFEENGDTSYPTYTKVHYTNLRTTGYPTITSVPKSLDLGQCTTLGKQPLAKKFNVNIKTVGETPTGTHLKLTGEFTGTRPPDGATLKTSGGVSLILPDKAQINEGDNELSLNIPCPKTAGAYHWPLTLTADYE